MWITAGLWKNRIRISGALQIVRIRNVRLISFITRSNDGIRKVLIEGIWYPRKAGEMHEYIFAFVPLKGRLRGSSAALN